MNVKIVQFSETKVAVYEHTGAPKTEEISLNKLISWRLENKLSTKKHQNYGVHYNDPTSVPLEKYRVDLCISYEHTVATNPYGIINKTIPAGRCAVVRSIGARKNISAAHYLYKVWLPKSGETLRSFPMFFHYVNVGPDISEADMITDVYLPLL